MRIRPSHARYPFFATARETAESMDIATTTLVAEDTPAVERGVERVERALMEGTIEPDPNEAYPRRTKTELLSYPISCIIVSLVETPAAADKYAHVEADTSYERMLADFDVGDDDVHGEAYASLDDFLRKSDLDGAVRAKPNRNRSSRRVPDNYWVNMGPYLTCSDTDWGADWRLINRSPANDVIRVTCEGFLELLREVARRRVAEGPPLAVYGSDASNRLADTLKPRVERLRNLLSGHDAVNVVYVDTMDPDHFPPCVEALLARVREGESPPNGVAFALAAFFTDVGLNPDEVGDVAGSETAEALQKRVAVFAGSSESQYTPPICETIQTCGLCVNHDNRCDTIRHPMSYFGTAMNGADADATDGAVD